MIIKNATWTELHEHAQVVLVDAHAIAWQDCARRLTAVIHLPNPAERLPSSAAAAAHDTTCRTTPMARTAASSPLANGLQRDASYRDGLSSGLQRTRISWVRFPWTVRTQGLETPAPVQRCKSPWPRATGLLRRLTRRRRPRRVFSYRWGAFYKICIVETVSRDLPFRSVIKWLQPLF